MRYPSYLIAALALSLSLGLAAEAQARGPKDPPAGSGQRATPRDASQRGQRPRPTFAQLDKNGDGRIVSGEVPERAWQRISRADANHDNAVTKPEFDAAVARRAANTNGGHRGRRSFEQLDKDHDGRIVAAEVPARAWQRIARADANHDNAVTKPEFDAAVAHRPPRSEK